MNEPEKKGGPPPWINPEMQQHVTWRDQDIVMLAKCILTPCVGISVQRLQPFTPWA